MKKIRIVQIVGIILFVVYVAVFVADIIMNILGEWQIIVMSLVLSIIAFNLLFKGMIIKSSTTMWFAITLLLTAILMLIMEMTGVEIGEYYYVFSLIPILSSLINLIIFQNFIYFKVILINISFSVPIILQFFIKFMLWQLITIYLVSIILGILICRFVNLDKEKV